MGDTTHIEWADKTFNPWEGCQKVGPGCDHCYAESRNARFGGGTAPNWGPGAPRRRTSDANWRKPLAWNREAERLGIRYRVFCASLADVFDNAVADDWRNDLWELIAQTPHLDWLLLTKRIGNVGNMLPVPFDFERMYPNVWLGATIVNRDEMLRDGLKLRAIPARVHFWSYEPALGDLGTIPDALLPDWVICGGESGTGARPADGDWYRSLRDQCEASDLPFLFKQHGEWIDPRDLRNLPGGSGPGFGAFDHCPYDAEHEAVRIGKKAAGRLLDGVTHDGFPNTIRSTHG